jgi:excisionase family DNA binding protein
VFEFDGGPLLTVKQVAEVLGVCTATVYTLCDEGALAHIRVRNSIRVSEAALAAFVAEKR